MADNVFEKSFGDEPDLPASILRYGTLDQISMLLCMNGALCNWKHVADALGFSNTAICGHFANFSGFLPAKNMLDEWIYRRNGTIRELEKVFTTLELFACVEELREDKMYKKYSSKGDDWNGSQDKFPPVVQDNPFPVQKASLPQTSTYKVPLLLSSKGSSTSSPPWSLTDSSTDCNTSSYYTPGSLEETTSLNIESIPEPCGEGDPGTDIGNCSTEHANPPRPSSGNSKGQPCQQSVISFKSWPDSTDSKSSLYVRSTSVPQKSKKYRFFNRSKSVEAAVTSGVKTDKKKRTKKHKNHSFLSRLRKSRTSNKNDANDDTPSTPEGDESRVVTVQDYHSEDPENFKPNLSPLKVSETNCGDTDEEQRPVSSGSEGSSSPFFPSSPVSPGYESGYNSGDNSSKKIYIVCNPEEHHIFKKAIRLYQKFKNKSYECSMFAGDFEEILEKGRFRLEMEKILEVDYVFLCVSPKLKEVFESPSKKMKQCSDDDTKGLRYVSDLIMSALAKECCNKNGKFMTILLTEDSYYHVPIFMDNYMKYKWPDEEKKMENTIHKIFQGKITNSNGSKNDR